MKVQVELVPDECDPETGEPQYMELNEAIVSSMRPILVEAVQAKVDKLADKAIKGIVTEHVGKLSVEAFGAVFQPTDSWGKKKGEPKTLAEVVEGQVASYLNTSVNLQGRPHYSGKPRSEWLVNKAMQDAVKGEIDKRLGDLREEFAAKIAAKIANVKVR